MKIIIITIILICSSGNKRSVYSKTGKLNKRNKKKEKKEVRAQRVILNSLNKKEKKGKKNQKRNQATVTSSRSTTSSRGIGTVQSEPIVESHRPPANEMIIDSSCSTHVLPPPVSLNFFVRKHRTRKDPLFLSGY